MAKKGKGKGRGSWDSDKVTEWKKYGPGKDKPPQDVNDFIDWFGNTWMPDFAAWGQSVRDDIVRLEGAAGFPATVYGDPGDPPEGPFD